MPLRPATSFGSYEIVGPLGVGGMGEVYRARDSKLGREIALKVLPTESLKDDTARARLLREARLAATLNHPNICTIHEVGEAGGHIYLAMELIEGDLLAEKIAERGSGLPTENVLRYGTQIATALSHAHERHVIHRDLKASNVVITTDGRAKVLDFGVARLGSDTRDEAETLRVTLTEAGAIVGTPHYLAPEILRGGKGDERSDLWALGVVLYEMASGSLPFNGSTSFELASAILHNVPAALPDRVPAGLKAVIARCLAKEPGERYAGAGEVRAAMEVVESGAMAAAGVPNAAAKARRGLPGWGFAAIVVTAIVATALIQAMVSRRVDTLARHYEIGAPEPFELVAEPIECVISPNGKMLAMVLADSAGTASLWVRPMDSFKARALPGTKGATQPFWSPDNRSLAFFASDKLKKIALGGGDAEILCDVRASRGGAWNRDGVILFAPSSNGPLFKISANGGEATEVTRIDSTRHETAHRFPRFLPDGRHYLFSVLGGNAGRVAVVAGALGGTSRKVVFVADGGAAYSPGGHLLFTRNGVLSAQRFDPGSLRLSGEPLSLGDALLPPRMTGAPVASIAEDGTLAYMFLPLQGTRMAWFDMNGHEVSQVPLAPGSYGGMALSPDGRSALLIHATSSTESELLVVDLERGTTNRLSNERVVETFAWAPDAKRVAYTDGGGGAGPQKVVVVPADGSAPGETVMPAGGDFRRVDGWTPDGRALIIERLDSQTKWDIWVLPLEGDRQPRPYLRRPANEINASVSPDGRWLCYNSDESGRIEGYVQAFPTPGPRYQVTTDGTGVAGWKADGKRLALRATSNRVARAVDILPGEEFRIGPPRILGKLPDASFGADLDPAWTRSLAIMPAGRQPKPTIRIVLDWDAMIAKR